MLVTQLCPALCDFMDCGPPGSSVHGILQTRILEWVTIPFIRGSSWPRDQTQVSCTACRFFTIWASREAHLHIYSCIYIYQFGSVQSLSHVQLFATPWTVARQAPLFMGILQTKILEWITMLSSRGSSKPRDQTQVSCIAGGFFTIWATREA